MGDVVRQECRDRGLDPAEHHGEIAGALREENGPDAIAQRSLPVIEEALDGSDVVLVDGIRAGVEVERFEEAFGEAFTLVTIEAPFEVRAERVESRGRDETDDTELLRERDERERGFGMDEAIARADTTIENTGTLGAFHAKIRALLTEGVEGLERERTAEQEA
jgi:dephospho-CoA kinase